MTTDHDTIECSVTLTEETPAQITPDPLPPAPGGDREQWLAQAAALIHGKPLAMPISYGFGRGGTRSAKGYSIHADASDSPQLFIHPTTRNAAELCARIISATAATVPIGWVNDYFAEKIAELSEKLHNRLQWKTDQPLGTHDNLGEFFEKRIGFVGRRANEIHHQKVAK